MITVVIADDHAVVRKGLVALLSSWPDFRVVAEARDGREALRTVEQLRPDLLIADLVMPWMTGLELVQSVHAASPATRILVLSMRAHSSYAIEAIRLGATGFIGKNSPAEELLQAVRAVSAGQPYVGREIAGLRETLPGARLTPREVEITTLVAAGHTSHEIARRLAISPRTAEKHRANVIRKLGLRSKAEFVLLALRLGALP